LYFFAHEATISHAHMHHAVLVALSQLSHPLFFKSRGWTLVVHS